MIVGLERTGLADSVQLHVQRPVLLGFKGTDLIFTIHHQAGGHRLHTSCGQATTDLLPQQRGQLVAHDTVQYTAGLLGIYQGIVDGTGICNGLLDHLLGDLIEGDTLAFIIRQLQHLLEMPGNGFSFAVRVSCEIDHFGLICSFLQFGNNLFLACHRHVLRLKVPAQIHTHSALGQIAQVTHTGFYQVVISQIFSNGLRLRGRLHDYEILVIGHELPPCVIFLPPNHRVGSQLCP